LHAFDSLDDMRDDDLRVAEQVAEWTLVRNFNRVGGPTCGDHFLCIRHPHTRAYTFVLVAEKISSPIAFAAASWPPGTRCV
jgi:hypothetical protein